MTVVWVTQTHIFPWTTIKSTKYPFSELNELFCSITWLRVTPPLSFTAFSGHFYFCSHYIALAWTRNRVQRQLHFVTHWISFRVITVLIKTYFLSRLQCYIYVSPRLLCEFGNNVILMRCILETILESILETIGTLFRHFISHENCLEAE